MSRLYISNFPLEKRSTLEAYVLELSQDCYYYTLKAKCRELARTDGSILVAPTSESYLVLKVSMRSTIWMVADPVSLSTPGKIQEKLSQLNLKLKKKVKLSPAILQTCYTFTAIARLAPKWNMISTWLVQGSDFFTTSKAAALDFEVGVTATDITLNMNVQKLGFSFFKVEDLGLTPIITNKFKKNPNYSITNRNISTNRCIVLPNLTTAYVYSASHHMPFSLIREFESYDNVRLHWKKQHGIMLPEVQNVFFEVFFAHSSKKLFSYPGTCVLKSSPLVYPERDADAVASSLVTDLHSRMPSVCGQPISFSTKPLTPLASLNTASGNPLSSSTHANTLAFPKEKRNDLAKCNSVSVNNGCIEEDGNAENKCPASTSHIQSPTLLQSIGSGNSDDGSLVDQSDSINRWGPQAKKPCFDNRVSRTPDHPVTQVVPSINQTLQLNPTDVSFYVGDANPTSVQSPTSKNNPSALSKSKDIEGVAEDIILKIGRSKIADLKKWLQEKGVKYRSKEKKDDLISMVTGHIRSTDCAYP